MPQPIIEPNFEGEEMKIPQTQPATESTVAPTQSILSTAIISILVIALLAIFAGLGYWYYTVMSTPTITTPTPTRPSLEMNNEPESTTAEARTQTLDVVSTSDEIEVIEADILSTNLDDLDAELTAIDTELNAALESSF